MAQIRFVDVVSEEANHIRQLIQAVLTAPLPFVGGQWTPDTVVTEIERGRGLGLWQQDQLAGLITWRDLPEAIEVTWLCVHPQFRRQGVMGQLLTQVKIEAQQSGREIWLEAHGGNTPARQLYEKNEFCVVGRRPGYYTDGSEALLYLWAPKSR